MSVLIAAYHAIATPASPVSTSPAQFESDLHALKRAGFAFASLDDCASWIAGTTDLPERSVAITFDDAYESVVTRALPLLAELNVPATVFAIAGRLGGDNQWPGQWRSIPPMPLADAAGLRALASRGVSIGCHSWSHPSLPDVSAPDLHREVVEAAERLEQVTGTAVRHFAYPYGHRGPREIRAVTARYALAVSTHAGVLHRGASAGDLPRVDCHDLRVALTLGLVSRRTIRPYLTTRRMIREVRRAVERRIRA